MDTDLIEVEIVYICDIFETWKDLEWKVDPVQHIIDIVNNNKTHDGIDQIAVENAIFIIVLNFGSNFFGGNWVYIVDRRWADKLTCNDSFG